MDEQTREQAKGFLDKTLSFNQTVNSKYDALSDSNRFYVFLGLAMAILFLVPAPLNLFIFGIAAISRIVHLNTDKQ